MKKLNNTEFDSIFQNLKSHKSLITDIELNKIILTSRKKTKYYLNIMKTTLFLLILTIAGYYLKTPNSPQLKSETRKSISNSKYYNQKNIKPKQQIITGIKPKLYIKKATLEKKYKESENIKILNFENKIAARYSNLFISQLDSTNYTKGIDLSDFVIHILSLEEAEEYGMKVLLDNNRIVKFDAKFKNCLLEYAVKSEKFNQNFDSECKIVVNNTNFLASNMFGSQFLITLGNKDKDISHPFNKYKDDTRAVIINQKPFILKNIAEKDTFKTQVEIWKKLIKKEYYIFTITSKGLKEEINSNTILFWVEAYPTLTKFMETVKSKYIYSDLSMKLEDNNYNTQLINTNSNTPLTNDTNISTISEKKLGKYKYFIQTLSVNSSREILVKAISSRDSSIKFTVHNSMDSSIVLFDTTMILNKKGEIYFKFPFAGHENGKGKYYYTLSFESKTFNMSFPNWQRIGATTYKQKSYKPTIIDPFKYVSPDKSKNKTKPLNDRQIKRLIKKSEKKLKNIK